MVSRETSTPRVPRTRESPMPNVPSRRRRRYACALLVLLHASGFDARAEEPSPALVAPRLVTSAEPAYPQGEPPRRVPVAVVVTLDVDVSGHVVDAVVNASGGARFDAEALLAAQKLVFEPATRDGKPIPA